MDALFDEKAYFRKKKNYKKKNPAQLSTTSVSYTHLTLPTKRIV